MTFCSDCDLLVWETDLLADAAFISQTLISGTADLSDTTLTIASGNLLNSHVAADQVVVLRGSISGCFPIVSVDSATKLTISIVYEGWWDNGQGRTASRVGSAVGLNYAIRTFYPQRRLVADLLRRSVGIHPSDAEIVPSQIVNPQALQRANALGTLHMIYSALAGAADDPELLQERADRYQKMYRRELEGCAIELDTNNDGRVDAVRRPSVLCLRRG